MRSCHHTGRATRAHMLNEAAGNGHTGKSGVGLGGGRAQHTGRAACTHTEHTEDEEMIGRAQHCWRRGGRGGGGALPGLHGLGDTTGTQEAGPRQQQRHQGREGARRVMLTALRMDTNCS